ncbi:MAG TPA: response regulator [Thermoanaerobaculia bacterium]|nr:response regulator [Thermoanaerobaculia bacterium]
MTIEQYRRVLVIDDDDETRAMLITALRQKSLLIDQAADGREALDLLGENDYGVVVLDLIMPNLDGFGVLKSIDPASPKAPVVLVVSGAERPVLDQLDAHRIHGIVRKPFDPEEIASIVAACADIRGRSAFETMALATMITGAPLIALLKL